MSKPAKILTLSFVGGYPETPESLYKQIKDEIEPSATLEVVAQQLAELAAEGHIHVERNEIYKNWLASVWNVKEYF